MDLGAIWALATTFVLVFMRVMGLVAVAIPFATPAVPVVGRVLLALALALILVPLVTPWPGTDEWGFAAALLAELAIGLAIGFLTLLVFMAVQGAGDLMDIDMGFGLVHVMDPHFGGRAPLMGSFLYLLVVLAFISFNGHHHILRALMDSFLLIPPGGGSVGPGATLAIVRQFGWVFVTALRLALPVLAALFILHTVFGILARTMPQIHVLIVAMPAKIAVGFLALALSLPVLLRLVEMEWATVMANVAAFIRSLAR